MKNIATGQRLNNLDAWGGRFSIDADPVAGWSIQARISHRDEKSAGPAFDSFDPNFPILSAFSLPAAFLQPAYDPYEVNSPTRYEDLSAPLMTDLHAWLTAQLAKLSRNHNLAKAIN